MNNDANEQLVDIIDSMRSMVTEMANRLEVVSRMNSIPTRRPVKDRAEADAALADGKLAFGEFTNGEPALIDEIVDEGFAVYPHLYTVPVGYEPPEPEWRILGPSELVAAAEARDRGEVRLEYKRLDGSYKHEPMMPGLIGVPLGGDVVRRVSPATWQPPAPPTTERVNVLDALRDGRTIGGMRVAFIGNEDGVEVFGLDDERLATVADDGTVEVDRVQA